MGVPVLFNTNAVLNGTTNEDEIMAKNKNRDKNKSFDAADKTIVENNAVSTKKKSGRKPLIIISAVALFVATLTLALVLIFSGETKERELFSYEDFSYVIRDDGKIEIASYHGTGGKVTVPTAIDGRSVASIGKSAFENDSSVTEITLGALLLEIGDKIGRASCRERV